MKFNKVELIGGKASGVCFESEKNSKDVMDSFGRNMQNIFEINGDAYKFEKIEDDCLFLKAPYLN